MEGLTMVYIVKDLLYLPALYIREHKKKTLFDNLSKRRAFMCNRFGYF